MDLARIRVLRTLINSIAKNLHKLQICLRFYSFYKKNSIFNLIDKKKWQITPILLFRFRSGIFLLIQIFNLFIWSCKNCWRAGFSHFQKGLSPDCTERPEWSAAERGLAVKAGRGRKQRASDDKNQKYR